MPEYVNLLPGDPAPWFYQRSGTNPRYAFHTAAGQYVVLCFFGSAADPHSQAAIAAMRSRRGFFNGTTASFFGVSIDPDDEIQKRVVDEYPGYVFVVVHEWQPAAEHDRRDLDKPCVCRTAEIHTFVGKNYIVTLHTGDSATLKTARKRLASAP